MNKLHAKIVTCKLAIFAQRVQQLAVETFANVENIVMQEQHRHAPIVTLVNIVLTVSQFVLKTAQLITNIAERALRASLVTLQITFNANYVQEVDIPIRSSKHTNAVTAATWRAILRSCCPKPLPKLEKRGQKIMMYYSGATLLLIHEEGWFDSGLAFQNEDTKNSTAKTAYRG